MTKNLARHTDYEYRSYLADASQSQIPDILQSGHNLDTASLIMSFPKASVRIFYHNMVSE